MFVRCSVVENERVVVFGFLPVQLKTQSADRCGKGGTSAGTSITESAHRRPNAQRTPRSRELQGGCPQSTDGREQLRSVAHIDQQAFKLMRCKARYIRRADFGIAQRKTVDHHRGVCGTESTGAYSRRRAMSSQTAHPHGGQGTKHIGRRTTRQTLQCFARLRKAQCRRFRIGFLTPSVYAHEREGAEAVDFERRIAGAR